MFGGAVEAAEDQVLVGLGPEAGLRLDPVPLLVGLRHKASRTADGALGHVWRHGVRVRVRTANQKGAIRRHVDQRGGGHGLMIGGVEELLGGTGHVVNLAVQPADHQVLVGIGGVAFEFLRGFAEEEDALGAVDKADGAVAVPGGEALVGTKRGEAGHGGGSCVGGGGSYGVKYTLSR